MSEAEWSAAEFMAAVVRASRDHDQAIHDAYQRLENADLIRRVKVHEYRCRRGCTLARVVNVGGTVIARARDYKFSPGLNREKSVPEARRKNTLDGERWWPGHTYDVAQLTPGGFQVACRHVPGVTVNAEELLRLVAEVEPGRPGKPTLL